MNSVYQTTPDLVLGLKINNRVPAADQRRQRLEAEAILGRLRRQPGVILADEVGMGKTFVALAVAFSVARRSRRGPVIVMAPPNLLEKWRQDLTTFCDLYVKGIQPIAKSDARLKRHKKAATLRYEVVHHSIDLLRLLDDPAGTQCQIVFLALGAMSRSVSDKWVRLALIAEALRRHGRGRARRLIQVKSQIHRFLGRLIKAQGVERAHDLGEELWQVLLDRAPAEWRSVYNKAVQNPERQLDDDPVPVSVQRAIKRVSLKSLVAALQTMPVRARGGVGRINERVADARAALREAEIELWKELVARVRWRSPLLILDEAHHLKNQDASLARHFQGAREGGVMKTGDQSLSNSFDRMLFLTATPFQLGHHELVNVMRRFGDVRWNDTPGDRATFDRAIDELRQALDDSQRSAIAFQKCWARLDGPVVGTDVGGWWERLLARPAEELAHRDRAVLDAYRLARAQREAAEKLLRPWVVRHNKGACWFDTEIARRRREDGAAMLAAGVSSGLPVPSDQLLPFFLAARSVVYESQDLLGEALCSSYEAFRRTRRSRRAEKDRLDEERPSDIAGIDLTHANWYLKEFDRAIGDADGSAHPKVSATVKKVVDLWAAGEKVLVFAFYLQTCRALRLHISAEIDQRLVHVAEQRLGDRAMSTNLDKLWALIQKRFFDDRRTAGRRAVDDALSGIVGERAIELDAAGIRADERTQIVDVMRRFLRVQTTLARSFPIAEFRSMRPEKAVQLTLDDPDESGQTWRHKFDGFVRMMAQCSPDERRHYIEAALRTQTGGIRVEGESEAAIALANVQVATGETRRDARARLMRAFNTPFFPDVLVCSEVMGEGVDLQRYCRHVIHHDLSWNPSTIEQRTGRVDRLGCKAEGKHSIVVCLPYLAGTADERQYRVMTDRERWFRVVMGQEEVAKLITPDSSPSVPLPEALAGDLSFKLNL